MTEKEYEEIARIIISGYGDFKLTEFMVFFQRFKQGLYGTFYGVFDPMVITRSLREFRADREKLLRFYEDKKRQEEKERERERHPIRFKKLSTNTAKRKVKYERHRALQRFVPEL